MAEPVDPRTLCVSKLPDSMIKAAVRRLRDAGVLGYGSNHWIVPGPQFTRLTSAVIEVIFEELVMLAEPDGLLAESIHRRRAARRGHIALRSAGPRLPQPKG